MLTESKKKPVKSLPQDITIDEIRPAGLKDDHVGHLDDDDILMQNVIGGVDNKTKKSAVE